MADKSNPIDGEQRESQSGGSDRARGEEYKVGPGHPPADRQWKKGGPSPNPRGRPRKKQSMHPDVRKALQHALNKKVAVSRGDKTVLMTRVEIGFEQLLNQFAKGDRYARRDLMEYADKLGIDFSARCRQAVEEALTPNYQTILDAALARRTGATEIAAAAPALAPPELLDDDAVEPEPTSPSPPKADIEPEPPQKPGVNYPKPFSRMTWSERRAWYPEWHAKKEKERMEQEKAKATAKANAPQAAQKLDQASYGPGRPPPGGFSVTTGKYT